MISQIMITWTPFIFILVFVGAGLYLGLKLMKRIDRAIPDRDRKS